MLNLQKLGDKLDSLMIWSAKHPKYIERVTQVWQTIYKRIHQSRLHFIPHRLE